MHLSGMLTSKLHCDSPNVNIVLNKLFKSLTFVQHLYRRIGFYFDFASEK